MRVFPLAWRRRLLGIAIASVLAVASTVFVGVVSARADKPSVSQLQVQLVESRQHLNDLYAQSAAAAERLNGAEYELSTAKTSVSRHRADVARALKRLQAQQTIVEVLTVEQLQSGSATSRLSALFGSEDPQQLLERASAYSSTNEATVAKVARFSARKVVLDSAARAAQIALEAQNEATARLKEAKAAIEQAITEAEKVASTAEQERHELLVQLAEAKGSTVDEVTQAQEAIDEQLDESGPSTPPRPGPDPAATPKPKPKPTSTPPPPVNPPPPSGSKVEKAIAFARAQLGEPYTWGGDGPGSWDCSGLTTRAWQAAGINLPHYAGAQYAHTKHVPMSKIVRGDLLYWSDGGPGSIYHVALYLGGGKMIHAPRPGRGVEVVSITYWIKPDLASRPAS